jgi:hypothetical protein
MKKSLIMPTEKEFNAKALKVIILQIDDSNIKIANQASIGNVIKNKIETLLSSAKSVEVVHRLDNSSSKDMLKKEIQASLTSKELNTDVGESDYAIIGEVIQSSFTHNFVEGYYYYTTQNNVKVRKYRSPRMNYTSCVNANIKLLSLPTLKEKASYSIDDCAHESTEVRTSLFAKKRDDSLVREAAIDAVVGMKNDIKNFFSQKGYIFDAKKNKDDLIIKTTLGSDSGAIEGNEVVIYTKREYINQVSKKKEVIELKIAKGVISDKITKKSSWIIVEDVNKNEKVHLGDYIKTYYKSSFFGF